MSRKTRLATEPQCVPETATEEPWASRVPRKTDEIAARDPDLRPPREALRRRNAEVTGRKRKPFPAAARTPGTLPPWLDVTGGADGTSANLEDIDLAAMVLERVSTYAAGIQGQCELVSQEAEEWARHMTSSLRGRVSEPGMNPILVEQVEWLNGQVTVRANAVRERAWDVATDALVLATDCDDVGAGARAARRGYANAERDVGLVMSGIDGVRAGSKVWSAQFGPAAKPLDRAITAASFAAMYAATKLLDSWWMPGAHDVMAPHNDEVIDALAAAGLAGFPVLASGPGSGAPAQRLARAGGGPLDWWFGVGDRTGDATEYDAPQGTSPAPATDARTALAGVEGLYSRHGLRPGTIGIQHNTLPDGRETWVVMIPGTQGGVSEGHGFDWASNQRLAAGEPAVSAQAVEAAMDKAGIKPGQEVALVGHSQGGLIAVALASGAGAAGKYTIKDVLTAGSPVANQRTMPGVRYLHLETDQEVVSSADGARNPEAKNRTTIRFNPGLAGKANPAYKGLAGQGEAHSVRAHLAGLDEAVRSGNSSARVAVKHFDRYFAAGSPEAQSQLRVFEASAKAKRGAK